MAIYKSLREDVYQKVVQASHQLITLYKFVSSKMASTVKEEAKSKNVASSIFLLKFEMMSDLIYSSPISVFG